MIKKVYLAGPDVFLPNARKHGDELKEICNGYGLEGVFPLDAVPDQGLKGLELAVEIRRLNIQSILGCDAVIANMTPFRGASMDVGTAYEMGYAQAVGKVVVGYSENTADYRSKVGRYSSIHNLGGVLFADDGMAVEDFGLADNLMITAGIKMVHASFEEAVRELLTLFQTTTEAAE